MILLEQETGPFKRATRIKGSYFWLKDLIDEGQILLVYVPSEFDANMLTKATTGTKLSSQKSFGPKEGKIVDGVSELAKSRRLGGYGQAFPITERHRVQIKFKGDWTVFLIIIWLSSVSRLRSELLLLKTQTFSRLRSKLLLLKT